MNSCILIVFSIFVTSLYANAIEFDYCIADPTLPRGPTGYACKDPANATADDFAYSGLRTPGNTTNMFKFGASLGLVAQFPALNGLGISLTRGDMDVGGAVPLHAHRVSELIIVIEGTIISGFIDSNNKAFYKTLEKGDLFVIPPALQHFRVNVGTMPSIVYSSFASPNPGVQVISNALFQSNLPTDIIQKITLLDPEQITKLKKVFGDTN